MNNAVKISAIIIAVVVLFISVGFLYDNLSEDYGTDKLYNPQENINDGKIEEEPEQESDDSCNSVSHSATQAQTEQESEYAAPDFTVIDENGNDVKLSDFKGKPVVINFWTTWCGYCVMEMPDFDEAAKKHTDVQFLMINVTDNQGETVEYATEFIEEQGFEFELFFDVYQDASLTYGVNSYPRTYFINADGELVTYAAGMLDAESLEKGIELIS